MGESGSLFLSVRKSVPVVVRSGYPSERGYEMTDTFSIYRISVLADGRTVKTVDGTGFRSEKSAMKHLGLAFYFPELRENERSVNIIVARTMH